MEINDLVWAKIKGFPFWPGQILGLEGNRYTVRFFGDQKIAYLKLKMLRPFQANFEELCSKGKKPQFLKAVEEALSYFPNLQDVSKAMMNEPIATDSLGRLHQEINLTQLPHVVVCCRRLAVHIQLNPPLSNSLSITLCKMLSRISNGDAVIMRNLTLVLIRALKDSLAQIDLLTQIAYDQSMDQLRELLEVLTETIFATRTHAQLAGYFATKPLNYKLHL